MIKSNLNDKSFDFDSIFNELGEFGRYQKVTYFFISIAIIVYGQITLGYVFTAGNLNYRQVNFYYYYRNSAQSLNCCFLLKYILHFIQVA